MDRIPYTSSEEECSVSLICGVNESSKENAFVQLTARLEKIEWSRESLFVGRLEWSKL